MYTTTYDQLMKEFNSSQEVATLGLSFFIWGLGQSSTFRFEGLTTDVL